MVLHGMILGILAGEAGVDIHGMILGVNGILQLHLSLPKIARRVAGEMIGGMMNGEVTTGMVTIGMGGVTRASGAAVAGQIHGKKGMIGSMIGTRVKIGTRVMTGTRVKIWVRIGARAMIGEVGARTTNGVEEVANGEEEVATNGDGMTGGHILQLCRQRYHQPSTRRFTRPLRQPFRQHHRQHGHQHGHQLFHQL